MRLSADFLHFISPFDLDRIRVKWSVIVDGLMFQVVSFATVVFPVNSADYITAGTPQIQGISERFLKVFVLSYFVVFVVHLVSAVFTPPSAVGRRLSTFH